MKLTRRNTGVTDSHDGRSHRDIANVQDGVAFVKWHQKAVNAARLVGAKRDVVNQYAEQMVRGIRRTGELIAEIPRLSKAEVGRRKGKKAAETDFRSFSKQAVITERTARNWQGVARLPEKQFDAVIEEIKTSNDPTSIITVAPFYELVRELFESEARRSKWRDTPAAEVAKLDCEILLGDFRELAADLDNDSVDLIFTDPPYDRDSLPLYAAASTQAVRVLRPGGSLLMYGGQYIELDILKCVVDAGMRHWWTIACQHVGGTHARMTEYGVIVDWKPIFWFVKGTRGDKHTFVHDLFEVQQAEKDAHDWQQAVGTASYFIENLTPRDGLVVDFFCGGGTTLLAADRLKRRWKSYEINPESRLIALQRIASDRAQRQAP